MQKEATEDKQRYSPFCREPTVKRALCLVHYLQLDLREHSLDSQVCQARKAMGAVAGNNRVKINQSLRHIQASDSVPYG